MTYGCGEWFGFWSGFLCQAQRLVAGFFGLSQVAASQLLRTLDVERVKLRSLRDSGYSRNTRNTS